MNGKICYLEIPSTDINVSMDFYKEVFGWNIRQRGDGHMAFDDTTGQVSGAWVTERKPSAEPGTITYIMVDDLQNTIDKITTNGGNILHSSDASAKEKIAHFRDPTGNIFGLYEEKSN